MSSSFPTSKIATNQIGNMFDGEIGFVTPWAVVLFEDGRAFINLGYTYYKSPGGTVSLKIQKTQGGYKAFVHSMNDDYKWTPVKKHGFLGDTQLSEVVEFDSERENKTPKNIRFSHESTQVKDIKKQPQSLSETVKKFFGL